MGMLKDFKEFALKGNVVDLAVAVIIGGAFGAIVSSLVDDVITPLLLNPALKAANAENIDSLSWGAVKYGKFLSAVIKFLIIAFILFLIVRFMKKLMKEKPAAPAGPTPTEQLLTEIRDELKKK
ncbi:large conductance mechanosensitive channel protein MscL [Pseudoflavitalea sp. G-6-1-2]|uniref:large conductance mechanosensitive channel protein MscL n=1 Tax=Pseudoflavitalea sp. G-6-1-2 TaxID=2728841 RepID=UPI00146C967E|nr:large conductance mechanosensitive channel protein MscL [Pseudoflavitalea sp. G-6-1-2]NML20435.1 large conductance mechanosensitive channel protein MscL [Pseudoflavitalea sp. G-6-1-2]